MPWLSSGSSVTNDRHKAVQSLIQRCLTPPSVVSAASTTTTASDRRFSTLLLEHGETPTHQDWAVVAFSSPWRRPSSSSSSAMHGHATSISASGSPSSSIPTIQWAQRKPKSALSPHRRTAARSKLSPSSASDTTKSGTASDTIDKDAYPTMSWHKIAGRLHLCSRSLVFEPDEASRPLIRLPFAQLDGPPTAAATSSDGSLVCDAYKHITMKAHNVVGPYTTVPHATRFTFAFLHSPPHALVQACQPLYAQLTAHKRGAASGSSSNTLDPSSSATNTRLLPPQPLPPSLVDVREVALATLPCQWCRPLVATPGTLVVTATRLYFCAQQGGGGNSSSSSSSGDDPASNTSTATTGGAPPQWWWLRDVAATARRYHGLRDAALEIYWHSSTTGSASRRGGGFLSSSGSLASSSSTLLAFDGRHDREVVWRLLPPTVPCVTDRSFVVDATQAWHTGTLSNYEYLLALNAAAGRSFHDLSRYPVFPWILADYTSNKLKLDDPATFRDLTQPVGALNPERLEYFRTRLEGMQGDESLPTEQQFLYGTHYSAPGYVLYYLVRSMPEHMLCLQNGKFDAPDRMFYSIAHCYKNVLTNHADVKELIPEFFNTGHDFDFLINARGLSLGATQNGDRVDDVQLPPWARSARDFLKKHRQALESAHVTRNLPRWVDLVFGATSRGEAARQANNLFHPMAYLGPRDLADMPTERDRHTAELQATEFGIVPDQLFLEEHPTREDDFDENIVSHDIGRASSSKDDTGREAWEMLDNPVTVIPKGPTEDVNPSSSSNFSVPPEASTIAAPPSVDTDAPAPVSSTALVQDMKTSAATTGTTSFGKVPLKGSGDGAVAELRSTGSFGEMNQPKTTDQLPQATSTVPRDEQFSSSKSADWEMSVIERRKIHNDAVSGVVLWLDEKASDKSILVSTSLDGGLSVYKIALDENPPVEEDSGGFTSTFAKFSYSTIMSRAQGQASQSKLQEYRTHSSRDPLASLVLASDGSDGHVAFAGGHDDVILAYGINSACAVASVYSHRDAVTGLDLITRTPLEGTSVLWPTDATHIVVSGSWDATVKIWSAQVKQGESVTIQREPLAELFDADSGIVCTSSITIPIGGIVIAAGCADGSFCVWNVHSDGVQVLLHNEAAKRGLGPCSVVQWVSEGGNLFLFAAFSTGKVASYSLSDGRLHRISAVSVGVAILSMRYSNGVLLVGCSDGGLRLLPVRPGSSFGTKPTLWTAVHPKGISCISSVTYVGSRCICCTGGEDGGILVFELKRVVSS